MAHPQSSPRGFWAKQRLDVGAQTITANSTGVIFEGTIFPSGSGSNKGLTANSTGVIATLYLVGSNSTGISADSTGIKIGSSYISTNSTGN